MSTGNARLPNIRDFSGVIFDLDGTLYDSMGMWHEIDVDYLARFGLGVPDDLQNCLEGLSFSETAVYFQNRFGITDSIERIGQDWLDMAREKYRTVALKEGAFALLTYLKKAGIPTAIASSNHYDLIEDSLKAHGIEETITAIITCDDVKANKPDPAVYLTAAKKLGLPPSGCLVFEDIPNGILAGKNAGMTVCAVEDSYSARVREEKRTLADYYVEDLADWIPKDAR